MSEENNVVPPLQPKSIAYFLRHPDLTPVRCRIVDHKNMTYTVQFFELDEDFDYREKFSKFFEHQLYRTLPDAIKVAENILGGKLVGRTLQEEKMFIEYMQDINPEIVTKFFPPTNAEGNSK